MSKYTKSNFEELKAFLYDSYVHDANLEYVEYSCKDDRIKIELYNPIFDVKIDLTFLDIVITLSIKGDWPGNRATLISLSVEKNLSYLQKSLLKANEYMEDALYLLFQMLSGDEFHIVSKEVIVEITNLSESSCPKQNQETQNLM